MTNLHIQYIFCRWINPIHDQLQSGLARWGVLCRFDQFSRFLIETMNTLIKTILPVFAPIFQISMSLPLTCKDIASYARRRQNIINSILLNAHCRKDSTSKQETFPRRNGAGSKATWMQHSRNYSTGTAHTSESAKKHKAGPASTRRRKPTLR